MPSGSAYQPPWTSIVLRAVVRGYKSLLRDRGWMPSLLMLTGVAVLFQLLLVAGMSGWTVERMLQNQSALRLQIADGTSDQSIQDFFAALRAQPFVQDAQFITREQTLEEQRRRDATLAAFLDRYQLNNPFPDTIVLRLRALSDLPALTTFVQSEQWKNVLDPAFLAQTTSNQNDAQNMLSVARTARGVASLALFLASVALIAGVAAFLRSRSIQRSDELLLGELLGERPLPLFLPFITEASILLVVAFLLSGLIVAMLALLVPLTMPALWSEAPLGTFRETLVGFFFHSAPFITGLQLVLVAIVATLGTWVGVRRPQWLSLMHAPHFAR